VKGPYLTGSSKGVVIAAPGSGQGAASGSSRAFQPGALGFLMGNPGMGKSMFAALHQWRTLTLSRGPAYYADPQDQEPLLSTALARGGEEGTLRDLAANPRLKEELRAQLLEHASAHAGLAQRADLTPKELSAVLAAGEPDALAVLAATEGIALDERFEVKILRERSDLDLLEELKVRGVDATTAEVLVPEWGGTFGDLLECAHELRREERP
jgi:hypothetical protein